MTQKEALLDDVIIQKGFFMIFLIIFEKCTEKGLVRPRSPGIQKSMWLYGPAEKNATWGVPEPFQFS
jgi:hypothetical protein